MRKSNHSNINNLSDHFRQLFRKTNNLSNEDYIKLMTQIELYKTMYGSNRDRKQIKTVIKQAKTSNKKKEKKGSKMPTFKEFLQLIMS